MPLWGLMKLSRMNLLRPHRRLYHPYQHCKKRLSGFLTNGHQMTKSGSGNFRNATSGILIPDIRMPQ